MKQILSLLLPGVLVLALTLPKPVLAADQDVNQKIESMQKELDALKHKTEQVARKSLGRWLEIGGDYQFRYDYLKGSVPTYVQGFPDFANSTIGGFLVPAHNVEDKGLYSNRFGLNLKAKATKDVSVTARLLMYKIAGAQDDSALRDGNTAFSFDRAGLFDGTIGHVPGDSKLAVDRVYATWSNIADQPIWFSIGRRPSTDGVPLFLKENKEKPGNGGVPALLVNYAFDGVTLGYAPEIDMLPGAYGKFCYGRGFSNGITDAEGNGIHNTDMVGFNIVPYDTDLFRAEFQYNRGINIFDAPVILTGPYSFLQPTTNIGDIDWYGIDFLGKVKHVGIGDINWFADAALSQTHPNGNTLTMINPMDPNSKIQTPYGLLTTMSSQGETGWAVYVGGRYDFKESGTKLGFEYNHGSKNWITFAPAADDMWTSKLGTRGNVYEGYIIQELKLEPISSYFSKVFFRVGYQYYDFEYTGSNSWLGAPIKISELDPMNPLDGQLTAPLTTAQDLYATFEVHF
jgi:Protein of unknown function (DUF3373)